MEIGRLTEDDLAALAGLAKRGLDYTPRTAMLAVVVSVILAILGTVIAVYLIVISP